jgi:predicted MarR family transcription regulator
VAGDGKVLGPVVSASHLADGGMPSLSEMEFAMTILNNAFQRWMVRCMGAAGVPGLGPLDVQILHSSNHRGREKTLADLCMMLNIEDTHVVSYALKKLEGAGLIETGRRGKEKTVKVTQAGADACARYREVREALLVDSVAALHFQNEDVSRIAALMRALSGQYDQAARGAASL